MDALSKHQKIALDLDGTLIGGGASGALSRFVTQHPTKSFSIITFRTPQQASTIPAELQEIGLAANQFANIIPMPVRYLIDFDEDQHFRRTSALPRIEKVPTEALLPGEYKLVHWKGFVAHRLGATVLVDDIPELVAPGCRKFDIELINANQLTPAREGRSLGQALGLLHEAISIRETAVLRLSRRLRNRL